MRQPWWKRLLTLHGLLFLFFVYAPIIIVVVYSFNSHPVNMMIWKDFTLDWYRSIFGYSTKLTEQALYVESTDQLVAAVKNSLIVAGSTTIFSTIVGTATALAVYRHHFRLNLAFPWPIGNGLRQPFKMNFCLSSNELMPSNPDSTVTLRIPVVPPQRIQPQRSASDESNLPNDASPARSPAIPFIDRLCWSRRPPSPCFPSAVAAGTPR